MATVVDDWRGVVIELDHGETANFLNVLKTVGGGGVTAFLTALGLTAAAVPYVAAAIVAHLAWEIPVILSMDQGQGVILTFPWLAPGLIIPATRHASDVNQNWVAEGNGTFISGGGDRISYHVDRGVVDPASVLFRLVDQCPSGWDKAFTLRDGLGSKWQVKATKNSAGERKLAANLTTKGQLLTFSKPATFGIWLDVFNVGGLGALEPGDKATFTWTKD